jgi:hypothetical protein
MTLKECKNCGKIHKEIPQNARPWNDDELKLAGKPFLIGYFWECDCKSTMFSKVSVVGESTASALMNRGLIIFAALILFTGCATYQPAQKHFDDPQGRDQSQITIDRARCGSLNGEIYREHEEFYDACMQKLGYKLVIDKAASYD